MLIGDIIISARELFPDLPAVLGPPSILTLAPATIGGGTIPAGTYFLKLTTINPWGETLASAEKTVTIGGGQNAITITYNGPLGGSTGLFRLYVGIVAGQEGYSIPFTPNPDNGTASILSLSPLVTGGIGAAPPNRSTAFLPDTNGNMLSAGTLYRWVNEALNVASYICKGIPDMSGVQLNSGQGMYVMPGIWDKFENCWYDGFPVAFDARSGAFYRNVLSGITFIAILQTNSDRQILEFQPQPSRSGGNTTLSAPIGINDITIPLTAISQIGLALGMVQVGTEIMSYSTQSGGSLQGCARGMGGTQQQAWPGGTPVKELNFRFGGLRLSQQTQYQPGQSLISLQVPPGWAPPLVDYLVARFREVEQNSQGKGESIKAFTSFLKDYLKGTKQTAGPKQLGAVTAAGDGYPSASSGGRIIVP